MTVMLLLIGLVGAFWPVIVLAGFVTVAFWWWKRSLDRSFARDMAAARERRELAARADVQNQLVLAGDDRGIYGKYPPP